LQPPPVFGFPEGKGARDPLDRPFTGRRMSAVNQAYRYIINLPCDWIIVTTDGSARPKTARLCTILREQLRIDDLSGQIEWEGADPPRRTSG